MKTDNKLLLAIIAIYCISNLFFLRTFPPVDNVGDESWMSSISVELLKTGSPKAAIHAGTTLGEHVQIITLWLYSGLLSLFFLVFGASIWAGRFLSFVFGLIVVLLTYRFGSKMVNPKVGLAASFLLISSVVFSWHSREIRPDMMLMAFATASVYLFYLWTRERQDKYLFLSGFISTLSVQAHPNGAIFAISIALIYLVIGRKTLNSRASLLLVIGFSAGFAIWFVFNYMPYSFSSFQTIHRKYLPPVLNPDSFKRENCFALLKGSLKFLWLLVPDNLNTLRLQYYSTIPVGLAYCSLCLIVAGSFFGKNRASSLFLLSFIFLPLIISNFIVGSWQFFHYSVFLPFAFMVLAISIHDISGMWRNRWVRTLFFFVAVLIIGGFGIKDIMTGNFAMSRYSYDTSVKEPLIRVLPANVTVMGPPLYYLSLLDGRNRYVTYMFLEERCPDFEAEMKAHKVEYILADDSLEYMARLWCPDRYYEDQIVKFLADRAVKEKILEIGYPSSRTPTRMVSRVSLFKINPSPGE